MTPKTHESPRTHRNAFHLLLTMPIFWSNSSFGLIRVLPFGWNGLPQDALYARFAIYISAIPANKATNKKYHHPVWRLA